MSSTSGAPTPSPASRDFYAPVPTYYSQPAPIWMPATPPPVLTRVVELIMQPTALPTDAFVDMPPMPAAPPPPPPIDWILVALALAILLAVYALFWPRTRTMREAFAWCAGIALLEHWRLPTTFVLRAEPYLAVPPLVVFGLPVNVFVLAFAVLAACCKPVEILLRLDAPPVALGNRDDDPGAELGQDHDAEPGEDDVGDEQAAELDDDDDGSELGDDDGGDDLGEHDDDAGADPGDAPAPDATPPTPFAVRLAQIIAAERRTDVPAPAPPTLEAMPLDLDGAPNAPPTAPDPLVPTIGHPPAAETAQDPADETIPHIGPDVDADADPDADADSADDEPPSRVRSRAPSPDLVPAPSTTAGPTDDTRVTEKLAKDRVAEGLRAASTPTSSSTPPEADYPAPGPEDGASVTEIRTDDRTIPDLETTFTPTSPPTTPTADCPETAAVPAPTDGVCVTNILNEDRAAVGLEAASPSTSSSSAPHTDEPPPAASSTSAVAILHGAQDAANDVEPAKPPNELAPPAAALGRADDARVTDIPTGDRAAAGLEATAPSASSSTPPDLDVPSTTAFPALAEDASVTNVNNEDRASASLDSMSAFASSPAPRETEDRGLYGLRDEEEQVDFGDEEDIIRDGSNDYPLGDDGLDYGDGDEYGALAFGGQDAPESYRDLEPAQSDAEADEPELDATAREVEHDDRPEDGDVDASAGVGHNDHHDQHLASHDEEQRAHLAEYDELRASADRPRDTEGDETPRDQDQTRSDEDSVRGFADAGSDEVLEEHESESDLLVQTPAGDVAAPLVGENDTPVQHEGREDDTIDCEEKGTSSPKRDATAPASPSSSAPSTPSSSSVSEIDTPLDAQLQNPPWSPPTSDDMDLLNSHQQQQFSTNDMSSSDAKLATISGAQETRSEELVLPTAEDGSAHAGRDVAPALPDVSTDAPTDVDAEHRNDLDADHYYRESKWATELATNPRRLDPALAIGRSTSFDPPTIRSTDRCPADWDPRLVRIHRDDLARASIKIERSWWSNNCDAALDGARLHYNSRPPLRLVNGNVLMPDLTVLTPNAEGLIKLPEHTRRVSDRAKLYYSEWVRGDLLTLECRPRAALLRELQALQPSSPAQGSLLQRLAPPDVEPSAASSSTSSSQPKLSREDRRRRNKHLRHAENVLLQSTSSSADPPPPPPSAPVSLLQRIGPPAEAPSSASSATVSNDPPSPQAQTSRGRNRGRSGRWR